MICWWYLHFEAVICNVKGFESGASLWLLVNSEAVVCNKGQFSCLKRNAELTEWIMRNLIFRMINNINKFHFSDIWIWSSQFSIQEWTIRGHQVQYSQKFSYFVVNSNTSEFDFIAWIIRLIGCDILHRFRGDRDVVRISVGHALSHRIEVIDIM